MKHLVVLLVFLTLCFCTSAQAQYTASFDYWGLNNNLDLVKINTFYAAPQDSNYIPAIQWNGTRTAGSLDIQFFFNHSTLGDASCYISAFSRQCATLDNHASPFTVTALDTGSFSIENTQLITSCPSSNSINYQPTAYLELNSSPSTLIPAALHITRFDTIHRIIAGTFDGQFAGSTAPSGLFSQVKNSQFLDTVPKVYLTGSINGVSIGHTVDTIEVLQDTTANLYFGVSSDTTTNSQNSIDFTGAEINITEGISTSTLHTSRVGFTDPFSGSPMGTLVVPARKTLGVYPIRLRARATGGMFHSDTVLRYIKVIPRRFLLVDQKGDTIRNMSFSIYKASRIPANDKQIDAESTDDSGRITIDPAVYHYGDTVRFEHFVAHVNSKRGQSAAPAYDVQFDNLRFDTVGTVLFDTVSHDGIQLVHIGHAYIDLNPVISIEWPAENDFIVRLEEDYKELANYMYDVYDGQVQFGTVTIWDSSLAWSSADVQYFATTEQWPCVANIPFDLNVPLPISSEVRLPRRWFGGSDSSARATLASTSWLSDLWLNSINFGTVGHEMGHYYFDFGDEYVYLGIHRTSTPATNLGYMQSQYPYDGPYASELSSKSRYQQLGNPNTMQWGVLGQSCWDQFAALINKVIHANSQITCDILTPEKRQLQTDSLYLLGPNDGAYTSATAQYDVSSLISFSTFTRGNSKTISYHFQLPGAGTSHAAAANVQLRKGAQVINEGYSDNNGDFLLLGGASGDNVLVSAADRGIFPPRWAVLSSTLTVPITLPKQDQISSTIEVPMKFATGAYAFLPLCSWRSNGSLDLGLASATPFISAPSLVLSDPGTPSLSSTMTFDATTSTYVSTLTSIPLTSTCTINAKDSSGADLPIFLGYSVMDSSAIVQSSDGKVRVLLDTLNRNSIQHVACLSSDYPCPMTGLASDAENVGAVYSFSIYPTGLSLRGNNQLTLRYSDPPLHHSETSLQIFKWNGTTQAWGRLGGDVDTTSGVKSVSVPITSDGTYGIFTAPVSAVTVLPSAAFSLDQNFPNPFTGSTTITYSIPEESTVQLVISDILGREVKVLVNEVESAGRHQVAFSQSELGNSIYSYTLKSGSLTQTHYMILLK